MKKIIAVIVVAFALAGCGDRTKNDLENVDGQDPQKTEVYVQPDHFSNIGRTCIDGVAFAISTRAYKPYERIPEWDDWCAQ